MSRSGSRILEKINILCALCSVYAVRQYGTSYVHILNRFCSFSNDC